MSEGKLPTLSQFFLDRFVPVWIEGKQLDDKTRRSYSESITHWKAYTGDPSLSDIDDLVIAKFIADLAKHRGKKPGSTLKKSSIAKHCTQLDTILKLTGPKTRANRLGQRLILEPPFVDSPKVDRAPPKSVWSIDELRAMYRAADGMTKPIVEGMTTPHFWKTLIVVGWFSGLRIYEMLHFSRQMIEGEWLTIANEIAKGDKGTRHYLHREVREHLAMIERQDSEPFLLYPTWERGRRLLYDFFRVLQSAAEIAEHRKFGFHGFRKAHATAMKNIRAPETQALRIAQRSVGHSNSTVTVDHYLATDVEDQCVMDAINSLPSPCVKADADVQKVELPRPLDEIVRRAVVEVEREWID